MIKTIMAYLDSPEAILITGMRRTGKTTLLNYIYDQLDSENKLFLDLENPLNRKYFEETNYEQIKMAFETLGIDFIRKSFIFLDEIQFVRNLPSVVKYLSDHYQVKFFLTGSAVFYLKNLFSESLAGRKYIFELFPLSFGEFLLFKESPLKLPDNVRDISQPIFKTIAPLYDEYMLFGGFPGVVLKDTHREKKKALDDIFTSFFQLEVIQIGDFRKNDVVRDLMLLLMQRVGSKLDIQKLSRELGVSRHTLKEYVSFLDGTYFIKTVKPFSSGRDSEIRKMPKVYLCDTGMLNHFARLDKGALFENSVFQSLRIRGEVNYFQKKSGAEIDFILDRNRAFEVKITPDQSDLKKLGALSAELKLEESIIVSKNYSKLRNITYGFML